MKVVILAGGFGTRISEESYLKPKPMLEIGGKPILWHIMKEYSHYGFHEFIICCGYKQHLIKEWFADYYLYSSDVTFDFSAENNMIVHDNVAEPWKVTLVDTGLHTMTGGRIKRIQKYVGNHTFMLTYGDGVSDIDKSKLITSFREKSMDDTSRVNAGYMVLEPAIFDYIEGDSTVFEREPLEQVSKEKQLMAYMFNGYWQCMDTKREMDQLNEMWEQGKAPWKSW